MQCPKPATTNLTERPLAATTLEEQAEATVVLGLPLGLRLVCETSTGTAIIPTEMRDALEPIEAIIESAPSPLVELLPTPLAIATIGLRHEIEEEEVLGPEMETQKSFRSTKA
jgi:hypothetical protein